MDQNLRKGDLAEHLGSYLLRPFAALAPVIRMDDHGIDAVATLLRRQSARSVVPEHSFYVQFKAASVTSIEYGGDKLDWLTQLRLPLFIASVDIRSGSIALYTTHLLSRQLTNDALSTRQAIVLSFGSKNTTADWDIRNGSTIHLPLGPAIMQWDVRSAAGVDFLHSAYSVLSPWLRCEDGNIALRPIGVCEWMTWETNAPPRSQGRAMSGSTVPRKGLVPDLTAMRPYVEKLGMNLMVGDGTSPDDVSLFIRLADFMERHGVSLKQPHVWRAMTQHWLETHAANDPKKQDPSES